DYHCALYMGAGIWVF
nr:immunoglobulin light chain junction region [Macaca mulatta]MOW03914.1 immunoglobulin light chain junction region [Macaca mulatta]